LFQEIQNLPDNTVTTKLTTVEQAKIYEKKRFGRRHKTRRVDRFEKAFAKNMYEMVGREAVIVDIPCGSGRFFEIFSRARKLIMVDYSENMLNVVKERFEIGENVQILQGEISNLPLGSNIADLCFCMRLFHHMKTDEIRLNALKELARISNRYIALSFYNKNSLRYYWRKMLGKKIRGNYITFDNIAGLAKRIGLEVVGRFPKLNLVEQQCLVVFKK
jgi:ubiquinone/menaquinone biosynthesis C-methylase UbiE